MKIFHFVLFSFLFLSPPLLADPPLFEAIDHFENKRYAEAAALLEEIHGPLAQAYKEDLIEKGEMDRRHGMHKDVKRDLKAYYGNTLAQGYVYVSEQLEDYLKKGRDWLLRENRGRSKKTKGAKKKYEALDKDLKATSILATGYAKALLLESLKKDNKTVASCLTTNLLDSTFGVIDFRSLRKLTSIKAKGLSCTLRGFDLLTLMPQFEELVTQHDVGDALYELALHMIGPQNQTGTPPRVYQFLVRTAAFYGSLRALHETYSKVSYEGEVVYWLMHTAQHPKAHASDVDFAAEHYWCGLDGCPQSSKLAANYCYEALKRNKKDKDPFVYSNCYTRLTALRPKENFIGLARKSATLFLREDGQLEDADTMFSIACALAKDGTKKSTLLAVPLFKHIYNIAPETPGCLTNLLGICYKNNHFIEHPEEMYLNAALELSETDNGLLCNLAHLQSTPESPMSVAFGRRLFDLLERIDSPEFTAAAYLRGIIAERFSFPDIDPSSLYMKSYISGFPQAGYRYIFGLPRTEEYQVVAENLSLELLEKIGDTDPWLTAQVENHLGVVYKEGDYEDREAADSRAIMRFESAACHDSKRALASFNLGLMHQSGRAGPGSSAETSMSFFEACLEDPEVGLDAQFEICQSFIMLNRTPEALEGLEPLVEGGHGRAMVTRALLMIQEAAESESFETSKDLVTKANDLLAMNAKALPDVQAYRAFLFVTGLMDANGNVIIERKPQKATELIRKLANDPKTLQVLSLLFESCLSPAEKLALKEDKLEDVLAPREPQDDSSDEDVTAPSNPLVQKLEEMIGQLEGKTVKQKKVLSILRKATRELGGSIQMGRSGSRFHVTLGSHRKTIHMKHGPGGSEFSGARLKEIKGMMEKAKADAASHKEGGDKL